MKAEIKHPVEGLKDKIKKISQKLVHYDKKMKNCHNTKKIR